MSFELIFTSSERGLKPGSKGFSTVAMTEGMPAHCVQLCESLSGYIHVYGLSDPNYSINPIAWSHYRLKCGGRFYSVCSRVSSHEKDYTGRTNKIAHHIMLESPEETNPLRAGPSALLAAQKLYQSQWSGEPRYLPARGTLTMDDAGADFKANAWLALGLDPEMAACVANAVWTEPVSPVVLLFDPMRNMDLRSLLADSIRLLPPERRWTASFCTYFTALPPGADCHIRGCVKGSAEAMRAIRLPKAVVLDLTTGEIRGAESLSTHKQRLGYAARTGEPPVWMLERMSPAETKPPSPVPTKAEPPRWQNQRAISQTILSPSPMIGGVRGGATRLAPKASIKPGANEAVKRREPPYLLISIFVVLVMTFGIAAVLYLSSASQKSDESGIAINQANGNNVEQKSSITASNIIVSTVLSSSNEVGDAAERYANIEYSAKTQDSVADNDLSKAHASPSETITTNRPTVARYEFVQLAIDEKRNKNIILDYSTNVSFWGLEPNGTKRNIRHQGVNLKFEDGGMETVFRFENRKLSDNKNRLSILAVVYTNVTSIYAGMCDTTCRIEVDEWLEPTNYIFEVKDLRGLFSQYGTNFAYNVRIDDYLTNNVASVTVNRDGVINVSDVCKRYDDDREDGRKRNIDQMEELNLKKKQYNEDIEILRELRKQFLEYKKETDTPDSKEKQDKRSDLLHDKLKIFFKEDDNISLLRNSKNQKVIDLITHLNGPQGENLLWTHMQNNQLRSTQRCDKMLEIIDNQHKSNQLFDKWVEPTIELINENVSRLGREASAKGDEIKKHQKISAVDVEVISDTSKPPFIVISLPSPTGAE